MYIYFYPCNDNYKNNDKNLVVIFYCDRTVPLLYNIILYKITFGVV